MDLIKIRCRCGQHIEVNRSAAGQTFRCPTCDILLAVPAVPAKSETIKTIEPATSIQLTQKKFGNRNSRRINWLWRIVEGKITNAAGPQTKQRKGGILPQIFKAQLMPY